MGCPVWMSGLTCMNVWVILSCLTNTMLHVSHHKSRSDLSRSVFSVKMMQDPPNFHFFSRSFLIELLDPGVTPPSNQITIRVWRMTHRILTSTLVLSYHQSNFSRSDGPGVLNETSRYIHYLTRFRILTHVFQKVSDHERNHSYTCFSFYFLRVGIN